MINHKSSIVKKQTNLFTARRRVLCLTK